MFARRRHGNQRDTICYICGEISNFMEKDKTKVEQGKGTGVQTPPAAQPETRPNRDRYSSMFAEDNPDVDFEDKEARYGRMAEERTNYRNLRDSGKKFSGVLDKHRWVGAMLNDNETNPFKWMAAHGIDIQQVANDPDAMEGVAEAFEQWTKKQAEGAKAEKAKDAALDKSLDALAAVQQKYGLSDEQFDRMWDHFWDEVFAPAFAGEVSEDTWLGILHAMNYDTDVNNAREEGALQARNEKHTNKLKTFDEQEVPPSFSQGPGGTTQKKEKPVGLRSLVKKYM